MIELDLSFELMVRFKLIVLTMEGVKMKKVAQVGDLVKCINQEGITPYVMKGNTYKVKKVEGVFHTFFYTLEGIDEWVFQYNKFEMV